MKWNKQTRGLPYVMCRKWNEMGYEHLQMQGFVDNMSDRAAKAERGSNTVRDDMKEQHMLSEVAEIAILFKKVNLGERKQMNPLLLRAKETLLIKSPGPQESKTERCLEQEGYQRRKNTMDNQKFI